jgi:hypothetical protein
MFARMFPAFSPTICGILREYLIALSSRNEHDLVFRMLKPHTFNTVTAHDPYSNHGLVKLILERLAYGDGVQCVGRGRKS